MNPSLGVNAQPCRPVQAGVAELAEYAVAQEGRPDFC